MEKQCQDNNKVKIIMITHFFFLSFIVDLIILVIEDREPMTFLAIYRSITITLCFIGNSVSMRIHKLGSGPEKGII